MVKKFENLEKNELNYLRNKIKTNFSSFLLSMNSIKDIENDDLIITNENDISIVRIKKAKFDDDGVIIYFMFSSSSDISKFILELANRYNNIYIYINEVIEKSKYDNLFETTKIKDDYKYSVTKYLCLNKKNIDKPIDYYIKSNIPELNVLNLKYYNLSNIEFDEFINNNYHKNYDEIAGWQSADGHFRLLGMYYTNYDGPSHECRFIISTLPNNFNKETVVGVLKYNPNYHAIKSYTSTYISYIETNYFYQKHGIFTEMVNRFLDVIPKQLLILSYESKMGKLVGTRQRIIDAIKNRNLQIDVVEEEKLYEYFKEKQLIK